MRALAFFLALAPLLALAQSVRTPPLATQNRGPLVAETRAAPTLLLRAGNPLPRAPRPRRGPSRRGRGRSLVLWV